MVSEKGGDYKPKYIKLDAILAMLLEKLNVEIDEKAVYLVAKYFDNKIEEAAAELATKFK
jgi:hypothetical protein